MRICQIFIPCDITKKFVTVDDELYGNRATDSQVKYVGAGKVVKEGDTSNAICDTLSGSQ